MSKSKMIFVGQAELYNVFSQYSPDLLDFQKPYTSIKQVDEDINNDTFDIDTCCIVVSSSLFHTEQDDFVDFIARISDAAVMNILLIGEDRDYKDEMEYRIKDRQKLNSTVGMPFYFVDYGQSMIDDIEASLRDFANNSMVDDGVKENIYNAIENFNTINDEEEADTDTEYYPEGDTVNTNTEEVQERGNAKIITITSSKGGVGKSTNTLLIASSFRKFYPDKKVCIVDLDITGGQQYFLNNAPRDAKTVLNILEEDNVTERAVLDTIWHSPSTGIDFLFAPKSAKNIDYLTPKLYKDILVVISNNYDIVLIDTNAGNVSDITEQVTYPMADDFVVVTEPTTTSLAICAGLISQELSKYNGRPLVIVNRVYSISDKSAMLMEKAYKEESIAGIIPLRSDVILTPYEEGRLYDVLDDKSFAEAYKAIVDKLMGENNG